MRIEDLVSMDVQGDFRSDVQLSDYENPALNQGLLRNYIFTVHAPTVFSAAQRSLSAKDVLEQLKSLFAFAGENRIALIANYGHGKSHLALVLANFFARPTDSEEVKIILSRLEQALNNASQVAGYRDFKKSKGEFLVIRLQGDAISDLQEGFMRALEQALSEHEATREIEIPFWYHHAAAWLRNLPGEVREKAEAFLATQNTDLPSLLSGLRRQGAYELVRDVFKHVTGAYPDFGREVSLEDLVVWAVDEVCIPQQLGGLLVLFDEFSLFLQKYMAARTVGKLQELLNGISKRQGKSVFLAFAQQDIDTVAETYAQARQRLEDVKKELERLPKDKRVRLHSLMESVLGSYLKQSDLAWQSWYTGERAARATLAQARESLLKYFGKRYAEDLQWSPDAIEQKVSKGCFPLHPLTTAILSVHTFESGAGDNPRTALQFVRRMWEDLRQQPAQLPAGKPNLVFAIALVDFFGEQVSKKWYAAYRNTLETSPIPLTEAHRAVLKALLLQQAVVALDKLKLRKGEQIELLSQLSGLDSEKIVDTLHELREAKAIQYDPYNKISSLWPVSTRPQEVEEVIQQAVKATPIDADLMDTIVSSLTVEIPLKFGHASDWAPRQKALTAEMFTIRELQALIQPYRSSVKGVEESSRGVIIWLIAQTEEETTQLRQTAQGVLDSALGNADHPLPVVIVLPKRATPGLVASAQRVKALKSMGNTGREQIGSVMYQQELGLAEAALKGALSDLVGVEHFVDIQRNLRDYAIPAKYRTPVQTLRDLSLKAVLTECYRQAYAYRVDFYSQYAVSSKGLNKLRTAVMNVARWLFTDTAGSSIRNLGNDISRQLSTDYLTRQWGLLSTDSYVIQRPTLRVLQEAWDMLESTFPPGCTEVRAQNTLLKLLNPPYGHDYNTLTLLLAAWIGYHRHEIRLSLSGKLVSLDQLKKLFDESKSPQEFLKHICVLSPLAISRAKPDQMFAQVNDILEQIRQGRPFTLAQAQEALTKLDQVQTQPRLPETKREEIMQLRSRLEEALQKAQEYDQRVRDWLTRLTGADFDVLLSLRNFLDDLPALSLVSATQPPIEDLKGYWETALEQDLETFCRRYATLNDLSDYKSHEAQLNRARQALEAYPIFVQQVNTALKKLSQRYDELKRQESEKSIIAEINSMAHSAGLAELYQYRARLSALTNLSPQTAKLRDEKAGQIEGRIRQYEQMASGLPDAIARASNIGELQQQRDLLLRNLDQVQGTPLYEPLCEAQQRINQLEAYFENLRVLDALPRDTPNDLVQIEARIADIEAQHGAWLSLAQQALLEEKKQQIESVRRQELQKVQEMLAQVNDILEQIRQGRPFTLARAQEALTQLGQAQTHPHLPETKREEIKQLSPRLEEALQKAQEYDQRVRDWLTRLTGADFDVLLSLRNFLDDLPALSLVSATQPPIEDLKGYWETALEQDLETFCRRYATLNDLSDYKSHETQLNRAHQALEAYPIFVQQVNEALKKLSQRYDELEQQEREKSIVAEINNMARSAGLAELYQYRARLSALTNLSPQTAKLRDEKASQIEDIIRQYEQFAEAFPAAINEVTQPDELRRQRDTLMRKLDLVQGTTLYQLLLDAQQRIEHLEAFFEQLRAFDALPRCSPADLDMLAMQLNNLEMQFSAWISPIQQVLLEKRRQELESVHHQKSQEAHAWLISLAKHYKQNADLNSLINQTENPHPFLSPEDVVGLEGLKKILQKKRDKDVLSKIEDLFRSISDVETRRQCLKRLQTLMGN